MNDQTRTLRILVVDDEPIIQEAMSDFLHRQGHSVSSCSNAHQAIERVQKDEVDLVLADILMPGMDGLTLLSKLQEIQQDLPVIMMTGHGTMDTAIQALRRGASDFLRKPINLEELLAALEKTSRLIDLFGVQRQLRGALHAMQPRSQDLESTLIGRSHAMKTIRERVLLAGRSGCSSVVVTGETGTGKEVVARAFHQVARGQEAPFIALNCPALPENLVESEMFGHVRGAFTGAESDRLGAFELAHGGTLFLDEISDLAMNAQGKLLRALETRSFCRVGSHRERQVDILVIVATNRSLGALVQAGQFRSDLLYRLNIFDIHIPPLRERPDDILPLANHFIQQFSASRTWIKTALSDEAKRILRDYSYPGNVRELRNIIERAIIIAPGSVIPADALMISMSMTGLNAKSQISSTQSTPEQREAQEIKAVLNRNRWNRRTAAEELGITYEALRWRIKKYGLMPQRPRHTLPKT